MCHFSSIRLEVALLVKWNVDYLAIAVRSLVSTSSLLEWKPEYRRPWWSGTLLGPEGSSASCATLMGLSRTERPRCLSHRGARHAVAPGDKHRPYLENCIVDASIFVAIL